MENRRVRLIERLCHLPEKDLAEVESLFSRLEGDTLRPPLPQKNNSVSSLSLPVHKDWPHAPIHRISEHGTFIVTASTLNREHHFRGEELLTMLECKLLQLAKRQGIVLEAWAVFSNHYHFVAHTSGVENQLADLIADLHYATAEYVNAAMNNRAVRSGRTSGTRS